MVHIAKLGSANDSSSRLQSGLQAPVRTMDLVRLKLPIHYPRFVQ
jgi:hypothetical protein